MLQGDVVGVVQVERAAFGQFETALAALFGAGEGALLVAVELALDQLAGIQRAAGLDEGARPPRGIAMDGRGDQVLAATGFAAQAARWRRERVQISIKRRTRRMAGDWPITA